MESSVAWALVAAILILVGAVFMLATMVVRIAHRQFTQNVELTRQVAVKANPEGEVPKVVQRAQMADPITFVAPPRGAAVDPARFMRPVGSG